MKRATLPSPRSRSVTLLSLASERYTVGADGSVEVYVYGAVSATTETSVSVTAGDGAVVSCSVPAGTDLSNPRRD